MPSTITRKGNRNCCVIECKNTSSNTGKGVHFYKFPPSNKICRTRRKKWINAVKRIKGYKPANEEPSEYQTIPLNKIEDFGVHCKQYYSLEVSYFKSALDRRLLDSLWNKYWVNTLSSSSLLTNADYTTCQIFDLSEKLEQSEAAIGRGGFIVGGADPHEKRTEDKLLKATKDSCKTTIEIIHGLMAQMIKDRLFNSVTPNNAVVTDLK